MDIPKTLSEAVESLAKFPGVGRKTAMRHALYLTKLSREQVEEFGQSILKLGELNKCQECGSFCEEMVCSICTSNERNESGMLCVIESYTDFMAIENSHSFEGTYFILGGVLNPLMGVGPDEIRISTLLEMVKKRGVKTVILAINPSVEGDATCSYIRQELPEPVEVERIGFGMPMGGSLEYLDTMTIGKALENRKKMSL